MSNAKKWVVWSGYRHTDPNHTCGNCYMPLETPYAIVHVEDDANSFTRTVCEQCGKLAEALFEAGRNFPGMEIL